MSDVVNDTEEGVDYAYDEGQGSAGFSCLYDLGPGSSRELQVMTSQFNIYFYRKGGNKELVAFAREVPAGRRVRLYRSDAGSLAVEISQVEMISAARPAVTAVP